MTAITATEAAEAAHALLGHITGGGRTQVVRVFAELGVADALAAGPLAVHELAEGRGVDPDAFDRLLRAGVALGLLVRDTDGRHAGTPMLAALRRDAPGALRGLAMALAMPGYWLPWGRLDAAVREGGRRTLETLGGELWDHYARSPAEAAAFSQVMAALTALVADEAAAVLDTRGCNLAIDVGGASGALVLALMSANPALRGAVLDLPHVLPAARDAAEARGLARRFAAIAGDFFEPLPQADLYLLKHILHDWDDDACVRILARCANGLAPGGRVAVLEMALADGATQADTPLLAPLMDLNMLVLTPGRERTVEGYAALLARARLRLRGVHLLSPATGMLVIEAERG
jgi:hypothetical protein